MKKVITIMVPLFIALAASAQHGPDFSSLHQIPMEFLHIPATVLGFYMAGAFILAVIKLFLNFRLKSKMIDRGVPQNVVKEFLQANNKDAGKAAIKWFIILAAIGMGLTLITVFQPFGMHSVIIMTFCLAFSFLGFYFFIRWSEKQRDKQ